MTVDALQEAERLHEERYKVLMAQVCVSRVLRGMAYATSRLMVQAVLRGLT